MQKCLFSAPDGPAGPGTRQIHLVTPHAAAPPEVESNVATVKTAEAEAAKATEAADAVTENTTPALVWPPSDEELDDWHVIPLRRPDADAPAAMAENGGAPGTAAPPRKPLPAWLANHRARSGGAGSAGAGAGTGMPAASGMTPRVITPSPSGSAVRAVSSSPLEDTAPFPSETTTAIAAMRRPSASAGTAPALNLAPVAQPAAPRPVAAFPAERRRQVPQPAASLWNGVARRTAVVVLALLAVGQAAYIGARLFITPPASSTSVLTVDSMPDGAEVFINGERRGVTPFKVELPAGSHSLELRKNGRTRTIPLVLAAGIQASQYVELGSAAPSAPRPAAASAEPPASGSASARTPGTAGTSGQARPADSTGASGSTGPSGSTPTGAAAVATPAATPAPPNASRGWVIVESGLNLRVLRNGEFLGSSEEGRLPLPAGRQELELVNDAVGYRAVMTVQVPPGRALSVPVELPQSLLNVSATPSARVWIDGREVGNAPINQLALPVGQHEIRFEHPEYGERRMTVLVRVGLTAQASVDFTR